jgi:glucose-1-phosphate cytidylyltransferase|tara:strand:+ start:596 stop:1372 length:777 start_codon:yes stop_codon:yes gene_type:complete
MTKAVILAGGLGTRLSEETHSIPKPMVEIGGQPILWHIMKIYESHGINDFIICSGYKSSEIKKYFLNYHINNSDIEFDIGNNKTNILNNRSEKWNVRVIDTGEDTLTGGRLKRIYDYVKDDDYFLMTYGDGLSDINISELINFHKNHNGLATVTAVQPEGRFGLLEINKGDVVSDFHEKPDGDGGYINGGFFVLSPEVLNYIDGDMTIWERDPMKRLSKEKQLNAYKHNGFWRPMDTLRDKNFLKDLWDNKKAPWKTW